MSDGTTAGLELLALAWVRWFVVLSIAPMLRVAFGPRGWSVTAAIALILGLAAASRDPLAVGPMTPGNFGVALLAEAGLGVVLGVCLSLGAHAVLGAATASAALMRIPSGPWLTMVASLVLLAAIELGLHHAALRGTASIEQVFPLAHASAWWADASTWSQRLPRWLTGMTVLGLALATPALLVAAACELAGAAVARGPGAAPALAQAAVATVRLGAVLVALGASWAIDLERWAESALPGLDAGVDRLTPP